MQRREPAFFDILVLRDVYLFAYAGSRDSFGFRHELYENGAKLHLSLDIGRLAITLVLRLFQTAELRDFRSNDPDPGKNFL